MIRNQHQLEHAGLGKDELEFLEAIERMCEQEIAPRADEIDRENLFPRDIYDVFNKLGLIGLLVSEEDGGMGASLLFTSAIYEQVARASACCALILSNSVESLIPPIFYADGVLKKEVLTRVFQDGEVPCFALTEPGAGSDATNIQTSATATEDGYVLNGRKVFCTNGAVGGLFTVFTVTDPQTPKRQRLSAFVVDRETPGFTTGRVEDTLGTRGSPLTELVLEDVRVPESRRLGKTGQGLEVAMKMINEARVGAGAQCVGISQDAMDKTLGYARERKQFGRPIIEFQAVQFLLADMAIRTEAARQLTYEAARALDEGLEEAISLTAMCKTLASDSAVQTALDAIQVHGGYGYTREAGVERLLRDAKAFQIFDGTNQIQRLTIAKALR